MSQLHGTFSAECVAVADDVAFQCEFCVHLCKLIFFVCVYHYACVSLCVRGKGVYRSYKLCCLADVHYLLCSICLTDPKHMLSQESFFFHTSLSLTLPFFLCVCDEQGAESSLCSQPKTLKRLIYMKEVSLFSPCFSVAKLLQLGVQKNNYFCKIK